jgi:hypothetical protein
VACPAPSFPGNRLATYSEVHPPPPPIPDWRDGEKLALALATCTRCLGRGVTAQRHQTCTCVKRAMFRICFRMWQALGQKDAYYSSVQLQKLHWGAKGNRSGLFYGQRDAEYRADFELIAKRTLTAADWKIFNVYFLCDYPWRACVGHLGLERGFFFHRVYMIEEKLGMAFRETKPYGLFPLGDYFDKSKCIVTPIIGAKRATGFMDGYARP